MTGHAILTGFCLGCALLALWLALRFPALGPQRPAGAVAIVIAAAVGMSIAGSLFGIVAELGRYGPALALLTVVLPALTTAFWAAACGLRAIANNRLRG